MLKTNRAGQCGVRWRAYGWSSGVAGSEGAVWNGAVWLTVRSAPGGSRCAADVRDAPSASDVCVRRRLVKRRRAQRPARWVPAPRWRASVRLAVWRTAVEGESRCLPRPRGPQAVSGLFNAAATLTNRPGFRGLDAVDLRRAASSRSTRPGPSWRGGDRSPQTMT